MTEQRPKTSLFTERNFYGVMTWSWLFFMIAFAVKHLLS